MYFPRDKPISLLHIASSASVASEGPSIKYVTLFLVNFNPPPPVTLCHTSRDPHKSTSHISEPSDLLVGLVQTPDKRPLYKFSLNCSRGFLSEGFVRGSFLWKFLSGVVFVRSPICQNTSVTTESETSL